MFDFVVWYLFNLICTQVICQRFIICARKSPWTNKRIERYISINKEGDWQQWIIHGWRCVEEKCRKQSEIRPQFFLCWSTFDIRLLEFMSVNRYMRRDQSILFFLLICKSQISHESWGEVCPAAATVTPHAIAMPIIASRTTSFCTAFLCHSLVDWSWSSPHPHPRHRWTHI